MKMTFLHHVLDEVCEVSSHYVSHYMKVLRLRETEEQQTSPDASRGLGVVAHAGENGFWRSGIGEMPELDD